MLYQRHLAFHDRPYCFGPHGLSFASFLSQIASHQLHGFRVKQWGLIHGCLRGGQEAPILRLVSLADYEPRRLHLLNSLTHLGLDGLAFRAGAFTYGYI